MRKNRPDTSLWMLGAAALGSAAYLTYRALRPTYSFKDKLVVITGGSRGLGLALAREFAAEGARLGLIARDDAELATAARELQALGTDVATYIADLKNTEQVERAIDRLEEEFGGIDVLVNNAGEIVVSPLEHLNFYDFKDAMALHGWAPLTATLTALPYMIHRGTGRIVNIASFGGKIPVPHMASYCMSKFALVGASEALGVELRKRGIYVTTVCPGLMRTGSHMNAWFKGRHTEEFTWFALGAATPGFSMSAERAARKIVNACRQAQPFLMMPLQMRLAEMAFNVAPNLGTKILSWIDKRLPRAGGTPGERKLRGWESQSKWAPSSYTHLIDAAAEKYNNLAGHSAAGLFAAEEDLPEPKSRPLRGMDGDGAGSSGRN